MIYSLIAPQDLTEARLQLHYAIQLVAATGAALAEPKPDYSHTSLGWDARLRLLVGAPISANKPFANKPLRVAIAPVDLTVLILDTTNATLAELPLPQKTLADGLAWLKGEIAQREAEVGAEADKVVLLAYPPDDFPDHPIAHHAPFPGSSDRLREAREALADGYAKTDALLQEIVANTASASPIYIWPHHFDMATLISLTGTTLAGTENGEPKSIGVGFSPGDRSYNEPYWYVTPYPYPDTARLPDLEGKGFWHTAHWVGAVLLASQLDDALTESAQIQTFLNAALQASQCLLTA